MSSTLDQMIRSAISSTDRKASAQRVRLPQVSLMPAEIRGLAHGGRVRNGLIAGVVCVALAVGGAVAVTGVAASDAEARSQAATSRLSVASAQLAKFHDVQVLQQHIALAKSAQRVGSSTAIDWQRWMGLLLADMPAGYTVQSVSADSATPIAGYQQGSTPLENPRAATVSITANTASITELPVWLRKLKSLPAYADATPTVSEGDGGYTVQVVVHLTTAAYITPLKGTR